MNKIRAPFTEEQVRHLNEFQKSRAGHPFTCGGDRTDANHTDGEGILVATPDGWLCPFCEYKQDWAWDAMADGSIPKGYRAILKDLGITPGTRTRVTEP